MGVVLEGKVLVQVCFRSAAMIPSTLIKLILEHGLLAGQEFCE